MDNEQFEKSFKIFWCFLSNLFNVQYNCKAIDIRSSKTNKSKQKTTPLSYVKVLKIVDGSPALIFLGGKLLIWGRLCKTFHTVFYPIPRQLQGWFSVFPASYNWKRFPDLTDFDLSDIFSRCPSSSSGIPLAISWPFFLFLPLHRILRSNSPTKKTTPNRILGIQYDLDRSI